MIKIRVEGKGFEIAEIVDHLLEKYDEDLEVSGIYEIDRSRSRAYIDIDRRL